MMPLFKEGDTVLVHKLSCFFKKPKVKDVVIVKTKDRKYIIKRIAKIANNKYFVLGDNLKESKDSRHFGWVLRKDIVGKVMG